MGWAARCRAALGGLSLLWREHYHVEVRRVDQTVGPWTPLAGPRLGFWADPFVLERKGSVHVFFEAFDARVDRGHIAMITLDAEGLPSPPRVVLRRDYHLSYPFVFEHEGALFMLPETSRKGTVELYRCEEFPDRWRLERTLMSGVDAADSNLLFRNGRWWLFTSVRPAGEQGRHLCIFHREDLLGEKWTAHPVNERRMWEGVGYGSGRNAGPFFEWEGRLVRPVQQNPDHYGQSLAFFEVRRLTVDAFEEASLGNAEPPLLGAAAHGHHVALGARWAVMDVRDRI